MRKKYASIIERKYYSGARARAHTHTHSLSLTLSLSLSHSHTHTLTLSLTHPHALSLSHTHTHTHSHSHIHTHTLTHTHSLSLSLTHIHAVYILPHTEKDKSPFRRRLRTTRNPSTIHSGKNSRTRNVKKGDTCNTYRIWNLNMENLSLTLKTRVVEGTSSDSIQSDTKQDNLKFSVSTGSKNWPKRWCSSLKLQ